MDRKPASRSLEECWEEVKRLRDENRHLRESSTSFGELAERLNAALDIERRSGADRRLVPRNQPDRREFPVPD